MRLLLEAGADPCPRDNFGRTPLVNVIEQKYKDKKEMARMLKEAEASSRNCGHDAYGNPPPGHVSMFIMSYHINPVSVDYVKTDGSDR